MTNPAPPPPSLPVRKIILALVLIGAVFFVLLVLAAGLFATIHEAAPHTGAAAAPVATLVRVIRHIIAHHNIIPHHK